MRCNIFCKSNEVFEIANHSTAVTAVWYGGEWPLRAGERERKVAFALICLGYGNNCAHRLCDLDILFLFTLADGTSTSGAIQSWEPCAGDYASVLLMKGELLLALLAQTMKHKQWLNKSASHVQIVSREKQVIPRQLRQLYCWFLGRLNGDSKHCKLLRIYGNKKLEIAKSVHSLVSYFQIIACFLKLALGKK